MCPLLYLIQHIPQSDKGKFILISALVKEIKGNLVSLLVDGSNNTDVEKLNPLAVKIFDITRQQVVTYLLDRCTTSGRDCSISVTYFVR